MKNSFTGLLILLMAQKIFSSYTSMDCFACTLLWRLLQMTFSPPPSFQGHYLQPTDEQHLP